jgi:hypothetical protein
LAERAISRRRLTRPDPEIKNVFKRAVEPVGPEMFGHDQLRGNA